MNRHSKWSWWGRNRNEEKHNTESCVVSIAHERDTDSITTSKIIDHHMLLLDELLVLVFGYSNFSEGINWPSYSDSW